MREDHVEYKLLVALSISVFLILLDSIGMFDFLYDAASRVYNPANQAIDTSYLAVSELATTIPKISKYKKENIDLRKKVSELESENSKLRQELDIEKYKVDQSTHFKPSSKEQLIVAKVMKVERTASEIYLHTNVGSKDGIEKGQNVIYQNILIGKIDKVFPHNSIITAIGSASQKVPVYLEETKINGVVEFSTEDGLYVTNILPSEKPGQEQAITSGEGGVFREGLIVGIVEEVVSNPSEPIYSYRIKRPIILDNLEYVSVIID